MNPISHGEKAVIDGEETPETVRYVKTGRCRPHLTDESEAAVPLDDIVMVPALINNVFTANWDPDPMPSTALQATRFMRDISNVSSQKFEARCD